MIFSCLASKIVIGERAKQDNTPNNALIPQHEFELQIQKQFWYIWRKLY